MDIIDNDIIDNKVGEKYAVSEHRILMTLECLGDIGDRDATRFVVRDAAPNPFGHVTPPPPWDVTGDMPSGMKSLGFFKREGQWFFEVYIRNPARRPKAGTIIKAELRADGDLHSPGTNVLKYSRRLGENGWSFSPACNGIVVW